MKNFETLEIGCSYKNKGGKVVKIERGSISVIYPFIGDNGECYMSDGTWNRLDNYTHFNLVEKIEERNFTELEVGATYRMRNGKTCTITSVDDDGDFPYDSNDGSCYSRTGYYWGDDDMDARDIIYKISDPLDEKDERIKKLEAIIKQKDEVSEMTDRAQKRQAEIINKQDETINKINHLLQKYYYEKDN